MVKKNIDVIGWQDSLPCEIFDEEEDRLENLESDATELTPEVVVFLESKYALFADGNLVAAAPIFLNDEIDDADDKVGEDTSDVRSDEVEERCLVRLSQEFATEIKDGVLEDSVL